MEAEEMFHFSWRGGLRDDGRQGDDTQQETTGWARTLDLCRMSTYGSDALPTEILVASLNRLNKHTVFVFMTA